MTSWRLAGWLFGCLAGSHSYILALVPAVKTGENAQRECKPQYEEVEEDKSSEVSGCAGVELRFESALEVSTRDRTIADLKEKHDKVHPEGCLCNTALVLY